MRWLATIVFLVVMISCQEKNRTDHYLSRVDSLHRVLEENAAKYHLAIDTASIRSDIETIDRWIREIDSSGQATGAMIATSCNLVKSEFEVILSTYGPVANEIEFTRRQLTDLRYDLRSRLVKDEVAERYCREEERSLQVLLLKLQHYESVARTSRENFESLAKILLVVKHTE